MSVEHRVGILGTGSFVPEKVLDNDQLEQMVDTSDEWIVTRTGIRERRIAAEGETTSSMALEASRRALEAAGVRADELDLIVVATVSGDYIFPSVSCLLQHGLEAYQAGALDLQAACSGFLYALSVGSQFIRAGTASKVLVVGAETLSRVTDYQDRSSCILFGDGAGAAVLSDRFERGEVLPTFHLGADGRCWDVIQVPAGGTARPLTPERFAEREQFMRLRGREVYKFAVAKFVELVREQREKHPDLGLGLVIPHQVNQRIIDSATTKLELDPSCVVSNIARYGNTSAASIPLALDEVVRNGAIENASGKLVVFCAFGAGLTWAGGALRW